jgi:5-methylcytosine-specific restriction endonuclease McrA
MGKNPIHTYRNAIDVIQPDGSIKWIEAPRKHTQKHKKAFGDISDIREAIFKRDNNKCFYCGSTDKLYLDHVMPKSIFKWHDVYNLISCCKKCNFKKADKLLLEPMLHKVLTYLIKVNKQFTEETKAKYKIRLTYHFEGNEISN